MQWVTDDAWINNDWHLYGYKNLSVFCGIWDDTNDVVFGIRLNFEKPQDHQAINFAFNFWRFELEIRIYEGRHWYRSKNRWYKDDEETEETRKEDGWTVAKK